MGGGGVEGGQRARRDRERGAEDRQALRLMAQAALTGPDGEGEPAVRGGVRHGCCQQSGGVGQLGRRRASQRDEEEEIGDGARHPDGGEPDDLSTEARSLPERLFGRRTESCGQGPDRDRAGGQAPSQPGHALQIRHRRRHDVDA